MNENDHPDECSSSSEAVKLSLEAEYSRKRQKIYETEHLPRVLLAQKKKLTDEYLKKAKLAGKRTYWV